MLLGGLLAALVAAGGAWFAWGRNSVTRDELNEKLTDRLAVIEVQLRQLAEGQQTLDRKVERLLEQARDRGR